MKKSILEILGVFLGALLVVTIALFGAGLLLAFPVMWLWNWVIVDIFQLPEIGYWQAFGLYTIFGILFKGAPTSKKD
jgi:hypothetical protein